MYFMYPTLNYQNKLSISSLFGNLEIGTYYFCGFFYANIKESN